MEAKIATFSGIITGYIANVLFGSIFYAVSIAFLTGAAAYFGQQLGRWVHRKFKKKNDDE